MSTPLRAKSAANIDVAADISISEALPVDCTVVFQPNGRRGTVPKGTTVLEAARQLGVEIESICGGHQTCGKCKVLVEEGAFPKFGLHSLPEHLSAPGEREQRYAARYNFPPATRLSCACHLVDDVVIRVPEESQLRKQVVRKAAGVDRTITVDAPMRLYYVSCPRPISKITVAIGNDCVLNWLLSTV